MLLPSFEVGSVIRVGYTVILAPVEAGLYNVYQQHVRVVSNNGLRVEWEAVELLATYKAKREADGRFVECGMNNSLDDVAKTGGFSLADAYGAGALARTGLLGFGPFPKNDRLGELMDMRQEQQNHGGQAAAELWDRTSFGKELLQLELESHMWGVEQPCTDSPRGCFQVLAGRTYGGDGEGYRTYRGSFHSLDAAQKYAQALMENTDYYTGYSWAQVADVFHGAVWQWDTECGEWDQVVAEDTDEGEQA